MTQRDAAVPSKSDSDTAFVRCEEMDLAGKLVAVTVTAAHSALHLARTLPLLQHDQQATLLEVQRRRKEEEPRVVVAARNAKNK